MLLRAFRALSRGFATAETQAATSSSSNTQLKLTLAAPHITHFRDHPIHQLNLATEDGDVGILAGHLPMIFQLRPGVIEVIEQPGQGSANTQRFFGSGGFATVNPDSTVQVGGMEVVPVAELDGEAVQIGLARAEDSLAQAKDEAGKVEATIQVQVYKAMAAAFGKQ